MGLREFRGREQGGPLCPIAGYPLGILIGNRGSRGDRLSTPCFQASAQLFQPDRWAQGTGRDRGTSADTHGQSGRHTGRVGLPLPPHTARVKQGWGEGMCRGASSTEACHEGGEVPGREKPQWRGVRFLTQGWGWLHLENTGFGFLGLLDF